MSLTLHVYVHASVFVSVCTSRVIFSHTSSLPSNEEGSDYENNSLPLPSTHIEQFPAQCRMFVWPGGLVKDGDGDGKHIEIRLGWLDAALDFHSIIEELLWLTLSLTWVGRDEDWSKWLYSLRVQEREIQRTQSSGIGAQSPLSVQCQG